jgi:O-antigen ligase
MLSIQWAISPADSWIEANRTLAYAGVFLGAIALGNLGPGAVEVVARGVLVGATAIVAYALASRVWPAELAELELYARIGQPFGYWNAVGATAALAFPLALWLGARRHGHPAVTALAYPVAGLLTVALVLTYSRSATLAAAVAVGLWLTFVPLRLRSAALVLSAAAAAAPLLLWATGKAAFTDDEVELAVREDVATTFGIALCALVIVLYGVGYAFTAGRERLTVGPDVRAKVGRALVAAAAAVVIAGVGVVAASDRGLRGTLADRWHELRTDQATAAGGPGRLGSAASARGTYWRQGFSVFEDRPIAGVGAGGFGTASLRFRKEPLESRHAHGHLVQTLADLGLLGMLVTLAAMVAWLVAALRTLGTRVRGPTWTRERTAPAALFLAAVAYGVQASLDWTWFVPGPTVMALLAAGFVAGIGPDGAAREAAPRLHLRPPRIVLAVLAVLASLATVWSISQPARADRLANTALRLAGGGDLEGALAKAREAQDVDPLALKPLFAEAAVHQRDGRDDLALEVFQRAVVEHPDDPQAWLRLADFQLYELDLPQEALAALDQALYLDPMSETARDSFIEARTRLRARGLLPVVTP